MHTEESTAYFETILQHFERRISLSNVEQEHIRSCFTKRKLLPRQHLLVQGEICRYETYVCGGFFRSFHVDEPQNEHTLHFTLADWWVSDLPIC